MNWLQKKSAQLIKVISADKNPILVPVPCQADELLTKTNYFSSRAAIYLHINSCERLSNIYSEHFMKIDIIVADDHPTLITGIAHELSTVRTLNIVGTAKNSTDIIELLLNVHCDILITDYVMPGGSAGDGMAMLSFLRRRYPDIKIIVFTSMENLAIVSEMLKLGIGSVLNKADDIGHLISAVHAVYAGATYLSPQFKSAINDISKHSSARSTNLALTRREAEVIRLYVSGLSVNDIANQLKRTKQTVSSQKASAMRKLGLTRDADLFRFAFETDQIIA